MSLFGWLPLFKVCVKMLTHKPVNTYVHMCIHKNTQSYGYMHTQTYTHNCRRLEGLPSVAHTYEGVI